MDKNHKKKHESKERDEVKQNRDEDYNVLNPVMGSKMPMRCLLNKYFI
ncbi:hypothetical protein [Clostridium omnivorum]|uniref:Uncharacterized protein n=1 Tax=Clostridium omnivorum TaxID=1604902 RepID=A0ABQ5N659_9CLOT|nr:hypothetical protein [Clostridium sp. E14]GLC30719.1 hypothetical protein bsdE14_21290 [Clostridium sp. E14]